jgi:hypothetical protein
MDALRNFLTLSVGAPVFAEGVLGRSSQNHDVEILYPRPFSHKGESVPNQDMWVPRKIVQDEFAGMVSTWFAKYEQLHDCIALFCGTLYIEDLYSEIHFLSLSQALEVFSRATANGADLYLSEEAYGPIFAATKEAIPPNTPDDLQARLKNALKYGNEISFRKRLQKLLDSLDPSLVNFFCENPANYVGRVVDTRNYLTHYGADSSSGAWRGTQLFVGSQSLRLLLGMLLLRELGLPVNTIRDSLIHSNNAGQISMWCKSSRLDQSPV